MTSFMNNLSSHDCLRSTLVKTGLRNRGEQYTFFDAGTSQNNLFKLLVCIGHQIIKNIKQTPRSSKTHSFTQQIFIKGAFLPHARSREDKNEKGMPSVLRRCSKSKSFQFSQIDCYLKSSMYLLISLSCPFVCYYPHFLERLAPGRPWMLPVELMN